jgi:LysM repeat protein
LSAARLLTAETITTEPTVLESDETYYAKTYVVKTASECTNGEVVTVVERGDNLWDLAKEYNKDFEKLLAANGHLGPDFDLIFPKDEVCVPKGCGGFTGPDMSPYETEEEYDEEDKEQEEKELDEIELEEELEDDETEAQVSSGAGAFTVSLVAVLSLVLL